MSIRPTSPPLLALTGLVVLLAAAGCKSPEPEPEEDEISLEEFQELITQGSLRPVVAMEGEDSFDNQLQEGVVAGDDPFVGAEERFADSAAGAEAGTDAAAAEPDYPPEVPENPYLAFGKRIVVHGDGRITKPYPLRVGTGVKLRDLILAYGNFPIWDPEAGPQGLDTVYVDLREGWDIELYADLRAANPAPPKAIPLADWLIVTSSADLMYEVEGFLNIFAAGVPQVEIEAKIVEVKTRDELEFGISPTDTSTPIFGFPDNTFVRSFNFDFPISTPGAALAVGAVSDGFSFNAVLQAVAEFENVSIISRPKIAVREGGRAEITSLEQIPFYNITGLNSAGDFGATLTYQEVGIKLYVVPRVVGTETVALNIDVEASQESGTSVTFNFGAGELQNPVITRRSAKTIVYLEPGQAVILGGLITEAQEDVEKKVPFLGDIPLLGYLFKSVRKETIQSNVLFFIRPRILQGSDLNREF